MPRARKSTTDGTLPQAVNGTPSATKSRPRTATRASVPAQASLGPAMTPDEVARRAYEIYERSGFQHGRDVDHWLIAERELQGF